MSTSESVGVVFDGSGLGQWTDEERFEVTAERIAEYAAATNDPIAAHRGGEVAPPVFAVVPVFTSMAPAALSVAPVELLMKLVHGEQDFRFHRPIRPGDELVVRAKPIGYQGRPNGSTVVVYAETRDAAGALVNEQWLTAFFRKVDAGPGEGEQAPGHRITDADRASEPVATVTAHIDDDQTFRYSPASGDPMPIHLDDEIARMAGLPGIINHGLCTMAFTSWAALTELADGDTARLRRLAVRFAKPVLPGRDITTTLWRTDTTEPGVSVYAFEAEAEADGEIAITDGRAEITTA
ncbi:MaoC/PaaZ C-terminal domain-containing protein [Nocardia donostiensis]|uniref:Dehydratase n=1 Tax=Nocardia donostiensis TaxID=1538463 RepID=A0A1W0ARA4_9NOCA|nr:MaoC/PaaZ C-terminal domain-containing protein [Nocardia donostiensis]ONM46682.1 dehydratase [Nocardia donostiensis]OQS12763.1 dehydratase [Nocardia donostiensis]OQS19305.1 dehydratase [Nocardia donostiensis]